MSQPTPYPGDLPPGTPHESTLHREYRDILGRPLRGTAKIYMPGSSMTPVEVPVDGGVLDLVLPPGTYRVVAEVYPLGDTLPRYYDEVVVL